MKALDLFCGAGGASMGLHQAGFDEITGVDIDPQPNYPFTFIQADILTITDYRDLGQFDFVWASPPCQEFSFGTVKHRNRGKTYGNLIPSTRTKLILQDAPYVIENVPNAPLNEPTIQLCGTMFDDLYVIRHREFEFRRFRLVQPPHNSAKCAGAIKSGSFLSPVGHGGHSTSYRFADWMYAMKIDWMKTKHELVEAVPPAYAKYIAQQLIASKTE